MHGRFKVNTTELRTLRLLFLLLFKYVALFVKEHKGKRADKEK